MNMTRKLLSLALGASLVFGTAVLPASAVSVGEFTDVAGHWARDEIEAMVDSGLMTGTSDTEFSPDGTLSRAMFVTVLGRYHESLFGELDEEDDSYTDTASGSWYSAYVYWATEAEIIAGYGGGLFGPNDGLTREQSANILYNYVRYLHFDTTAAKTAPLAGYTDRGDISTWAVDAMTWAVDSGMVNGTDDTTLSPGTGMSRAQAAVMLDRFITTYAISEKSVFTKDTISSSGYYAMKMNDTDLYYHVSYKNEGTEDVLLFIHKYDLHNLDISERVEPGQTYVTTGSCNDLIADDDGYFWIFAQMRRAGDGGSPNPGTLMVLASNMPFGE